MSESYQNKGNFNLIKLVKSLQQTPPLFHCVHIELYFAFGNDGFDNI